MNWIDGVCHFCLSFHFNNRHTYAIAIGWEQEGESLSIQYKPFDVITKENMKINEESERTRILTWWGLNTILIEYHQNSVHLLMICFDIHIVWYDVDIEHIDLFYQKKNHFNRIRQMLYFSDVASHYAYLF